MTKIKDLDFNGYRAVLLRYDDYEEALTVRDDYLAGLSDTPGTYSLCDYNSCEPLGVDEELDDIIAEWKVNVDWDRSYGSEDN